MGGVGADYIIFGDRPERDRFVQQSGEVLESEHHPLVPLVRHCRWIGSARRRGGRERSECVGMRKMSADGGP
jgi:hypothetical protein